MQRYLGSPRNDDTTWLFYCYTVQLSIRRWPRGNGQPMTVHVITVGMRFNCESSRLHRLLASRRRAPPTTPLSLPPPSPWPTHRRRPPPPPLPSSAHADRRRRRRCHRKTHRFLWRPRARRHLQSTRCILLCAFHARQPRRRASRRGRGVGRSVARDRAALLAARAVFVEAWRRSVCQARRRIIASTTVGSHYDRFARLATRTSERTS